MSSRAVNRSAAQWSQLMAQYNNGAEAERVFCERQGIKLGTFRKWRYQLAQEAGQAGRQRKPQGFVQVRAQARSSHSPSIVTIHAPGAVRIDCPASLGVDTITQLARAVRDER